MAGCVCDVACCCFIAAPLSSFKCAVFDTHRHKAMVGLRKIVFVWSKVCA